MLKEKEENKLSDRLMNILNNSKNNSRNVNKVNNNSIQPSDINPDTGFSNRLTSIMATTRGMDKYNQQVEEANQTLQGYQKLVNSIKEDKIKRIAQNSNREIASANQEVAQIAETEIPEESSNQEAEPQELQQENSISNEPSIDINATSLDDREQKFESYINAKKASMQAASNAIQENAKKQEENKKNLEEKNKTLIEQANEQFKKQHPATVNTEVPNRNNTIINADIRLANHTETKDLKAVKSGDLFKLTDGKVDDRKQAQKIVDSAFGIGGNILMGIESVAPSTTHYMNEGGELATAKAGAYLAKHLVNADDKTAELFGEEVFSKLWELTEISKINKKLNSDELREWRKETISKNVTKTYYGEKIAEIAPSVGQNTIPMVLSYFNPPAGTILFMTSAAGSYLEDAQERGMNKEQAFAYATVMGGLEGVTEEAISGKMLSNSMKLFGGIGLTEEVLNSFGVSTVENFFQEAIMEPLQEATASAIGGKDKANWDNIEERSLEAGVNGVLSAILLNGASVGIASASNIVNKKNPSKTEIQTALADTINSGKVDINSIVNGAKEAIKENKYYINTEKFFINETSNNETANIKETNGIKIELLNNKLNVIPAVVKNDNSFIVIDAETGIKLDTTNYTSQTEAIKGFNDKIRNLDDASIDNINNKITEGKLSLINQIENNAKNNQNVEDNTQQVNNNESMSQNFKKRFRKI